MKDFLTPRIQNRLFLAIFLALFINAAFVSSQHTAEIDVTANGSNTLSNATRKVLTQLSAPVQVTVYLKTAHPLRRQIKHLVERYRQKKADLSLEFIDPEIELVKTKGLTIGSQGLTVISYRGHEEQVQFLDEFSFTNALAQLAKSNEVRWVSFLTGHGERSPTGMANFDLGLLGTQLLQRDIKVQPLNLAELTTIPSNISVLVLATPRVALLSGEILLLQTYLNQGGNLLLLTDPDEHYLSALEQQLGVGKLAGTVIDESGKLYGLDKQNFALVSQYLSHPITQGLQTMTVYPTAAPLMITQKTTFQTAALFQSGAETWTNANPKKGALPLAYALTREIVGKQQRVVIVGDGDFLSNTFVGNVGNMEMGLRIFNWLTHDDDFVDIPIKVAPGRSLQLSPLLLGSLSSFFLLVLPLLLIITGFVINYQRKRR